MAKNLVFESESESESRLTCPWQWHLPHVDQRHNPLSCHWDTADLRHRTFLGTHSFTTRPLTEAIVLLTSQISNWNWYLKHAYKGDTETTTHLQKRWREESRTVCMSGAYVECNGSRVELQTLNYENPVLRC